MSSKDKEIPIICFDGNHRVGKGTQIKLLGATLLDIGVTPLILRGDGSRTGLGTSEGDPVSEWWQGFKHKVHDADNEYDVWREGARRLMAEAALKIESHNGFGTAIVLLDRGRLSRTQMTIKEGLPVNNDTLYRNDGNDSFSDDVVLSIVPDLTVYMQAPTRVLLNRLSRYDPKYEFRRSNIVGSAETYDLAFDEVSGNTDSIELVDAADDPLDVARKVRRLIASYGLINLRSSNDQ